MDDRTQTISGSHGENVAVPGGNTTASDEDSGPSRPPGRMVIEGIVPGQVTLQSSTLSSGVRFLAAARSRGLTLRIRKAGHPKDHGPRRLKPSPILFVASNKAREPEPKGRRDPTKLVTARRIQPI